MTTVSTYLPGEMTQEFLVFDQANPQVWNLFVAELDRWIEEGRGKIGISLLIGRARWVFTQMSTTGTEFKIDDHTASFYARKLMAEHPRFLGRMDCRRADEATAWLRENYAPVIAAAVLNEGDFVPCPACKAVVGSRCISNKGTALPKYHEPRIKRLYTLATAVAEVSE